MKKMKFFLNFRLLTATLLLALILAIFPSVARASASLRMENFATLMGVDLAPPPPPGLPDPNIGYGAALDEANNLAIVYFPTYLLEDDLGTVTPTISTKLVNYSVQGYAGSVKEVTANEEIDGYKLATPFTFTIDDTSAAKGLRLDDALRVYYSSNAESVAGQPLTFSDNTTSFTNEGLTAGHYYVFADVKNQAPSLPDDQRTFLSAETPLEAKEYTGFFVTDAIDFEASTPKDVTINVVFALVNNTDQPGLAPLKEQGTPAFSYAGLAMAEFSTDADDGTWYITPPPGFFVHQRHKVESGTIGTAGNIPNTPFANDRIVLRKLFTTDMFAAENPSFTKDFKLQGVEGEVITDYVFVNSADEAVNAENINTLNFWVEGLVGEAIAENQDYTIYYEATTDNEGMLNSTVYFLTTEVVTNNTAREYVSEFVQADPAFTLPADYRALYINTINGADEGIRAFVTPPYAFVNQFSPVGGSSVQAPGSISTITTVPESFFTAPADDNPKFVTYAVQFITQSANTGEPLNDLTTDDVIVRKYDLTTYLPAGNYTFVDAKPATLTEPVAWIAKASDPSDYIPITTNNKPTVLEKGEKYIIYYTVPIDPATRKAIGNVAVLVKTLSFPPEADNAYYSDFFPSGAYGQEGASGPGPITIKGEGAPFSQEFLETNYRKNQSLVQLTKINGDASSSPVIGFELTGFSETAAKDDLDAYIFTRKFTYAYPAGVDETNAPLINIENIQLEKWDDEDKAPEFKADFELAPDLLILDPKRTSPLTREEVQELDGKYWLTKIVTSPDGTINEEELVDVRAGNERFAPWTTTYTLYFVIQDNGDFDLNPDQGTIRDPNALYAGAPRPGGSSSGCSVGGSEVYDLVLLLLASLGLLALRVKTRKN